MKLIDFVFLSFVALAGGGAILSHLQLGYVEPVAVVENDEPAVPEATPSPAKKCECIQCGCGSDCKCSGGKCECSSCSEPVARPIVVTPIPDYTEAYAQAMREKRGLIVVAGDANPVGMDIKIAGKIVCFADDQFKLPSGVYVYEFKSDGRRPAGLYGGLYSGASSRPGAKDAGPVYQCGPNGCRRVR